MHSLYCVQIGSPLSDEPTDPIRVRATALGCQGVCVGDPSQGGITKWPSAYVIGDYTPFVLIPDDTGEATAAQVTAAMTAATNAETQAANVKTNLYTNVTARQKTIQAWITANPSGAVMTGAQTLILAEMLNGLFDILLAEFGSIAGT